MLSHHEEGEQVDELVEVVVGLEVILDPKGDAINDNTRFNVTRGCTYKEFLAFNPKEYKGKGGAIVYTRWIKKMESVQDMSGCRDSQKVKYTAGSFVGKRIERYVYGLAPQIRGMVVATEPKTIQKAMQIAGILTDEAFRNGSIKKNRKKSRNKGEPSKDRNVRDDNKRTRTGNAFATTTNPVERERTWDFKDVPRNVNPVNVRNPTARGHRNHGIQARGRAFMLGADEARQDPNIMTGIEPSDLGFSYEIEIASESGNFDVIIGMDWLSDHKAEIICHEKVVRIPLLDGKVLRVLGKKLEENMRQLMSAKAKEKIQEEIIVVKDFLEIFPDDLFRLPSVQAIEFRIELIPRAMPVAKYPYHLAPYELEELSGQLKEFQDKGFICQARRLKEHRHLALLLDKQFVNCYKSYCDIKTKDFIDAVKDYYCCWSSWKRLSRNKPDLDSISMDDLYNNLKVYEPEVKGVSSSSPNTQNMAFVSFSLNNNTNSSNEIANTAFEINTAVTQVNAANSTNIDNLSDAIICAFLESQSNSSQLVNEDLKQIRPDDLEDIDLKWQMATGHFARECRAPRAQDNRNTESTRRNVPVETTNSLALVSCDGFGGYDWSDQAKEGPNYALMAYSTSCSDSKVSIDSNCLKTCLKTIETLKSQNRQLLKDLKKYELMFLGYKASLKSVKERLEFFKTNESIYSENIKKLKFEIYYNKITIRELRKKLETIQKEKDGIQLIVEKLENASKSLNKLINSQIVCNSTSIHRFVMPPKPDLSYISLEEFTSEPTIETLNAKTSEDIPRVVKKDNGSLIIKDWKSNDDDKSVPQPKIEKKTVKPSVAKAKEVLNAVKGNEVYVVKALACVSQMCDKKNSVLFNDTECVVLSPDFKLTDKNQALLRVPRKNNMYSVDLKNIIPKGGLTCLFAKAISDESRLWHRRLGHLNFKTMNKLVKGKSYHLGKFNGKADEGLFIGYSINSNAFRVINSRTKRVEETLHIRFSENTPNNVGSGPNWLFDINALTKTINYQPVVAEPKSSLDAGFKPSNDVGKKVNEVPRKENKCKDQEEKDSVNSTNRVNDVCSTVNATRNEVNAVG
uniref:Uncharacterized protein n=1 Tax=Tanacetum cinerariifolium TaxID=118510 RepID=A0A6L2P2Y0_TANCI|nr:hypothetical protein [Tanacetum cinerariifolium]